MNEPAITPRILLVEDEPHIAQGIIFNLEAEGYEIVHADTGEKGLELFGRGGITLVILDLMLPGISGLEVCREIREQDLRIPILMLTARGEEESRIAGLSEGADDYLTKPFSLTEFLLRVQRMVKRYQWYQLGERKFRIQFFGENRIDLNSRKASTAQGEVELTEQEARLLEVFITHEGETLERDRLLAEAWGLDPTTETRTLDNFMVRLRRYFEADPSRPQHFITVRGKGYRFLRNPS